MRQKIYYQYRNYPFSPELTRKSKYVGYYTDWFMAIPLLGFSLFVWYYLFGLDALASEDFPFGLVLLGIFVGWIFILSQIRKAIYKKMDKQHKQIMEDIKANDPRRFMEIVMELQCSKINEQRLYEALETQQKKQ